MVSVLILTSPKIDPFFGEVLMKMMNKIALQCTVFILVCSIIFPKTASGITIQEEEDLSREFMKLIKAHYEIIKDPAIVNYVNNVGQKLVSTLPPQPFSYHFYVIKEDAYNAFAIPAGHIFIYSGLLAALDSEEELACILAHEISHVVCRHISQKIELAKKVNIATLAGVVAGVLLGIGGGSAAANAVTLGSVAAGQSLTLAFSREDERQADQIGLGILRKAGYNGIGLITSLKKMRSQEFFGSNQIPTYLQTHPGSEERMAYIDTWLEKHKKAIISVDPYPFDRAHTQLVALYGDEAQAQQKFQSEVSKHPDNPLGHYGYALVLEREGDRKDAVEQLKTALAKKGFDPYMLKDIGRLYFMEGDYQKAFSILDGASSIISNDPEALYYLGRAQAELGQLTDAVSTFEKLIATHRDYTQAYYALGETYYKLGKNDFSHYYLGMYYKNKSDFKTAAFHLQKALETMNDPDKRADIEKLLRQIKKNGEKRNEKSSMEQNWNLSFEDIHQQRSK
jgi:predicted Zn-dependent protease